MEKSKEYKKGFIDGYRKARMDSIKIRKKGDKEIKKIRELLNKLRMRNC